MSIILLPESEIEKLEYLSGQTSQDAFVLGSKEAQRRSRTYSDKETTHLGWKLIREHLRTNKKLPRQKKTTQEQEPKVPTPDQIKESLFKAWVEGKIKEVKK